MSILYCQKSSNIFFADFFCANTFQLQYHYMQPLELFPGKYKYVTLWYTMIPNITTRTVRDSEVRCDSTVSSQKFVRSRVHCRRDPNLPYPASMLLKLRNIPTKDALHTRIFVKLQNIVYFGTEAATYVPNYTHEVWSKIFKIRIRLDI